MPNSVTQWLEQLDLGEYAKTFADNAIDVEVLPELTDADLEKMGIKLGHRKKMGKAIAALTVQRSTDSARVTDTVADRAVKSDEALAGWERHPGERKPVTLLFADITGSTALTENLDAEQAHEALYGVTKKMCEAVENNRGTVCRFMGDGVMAMFGAPVASEQHAVEACSAAIDMQRAIRDYATTGGAASVKIRVGIHSGEVVVLTVGEGDTVEYDASGPTVPLAARMEQAAAPGEVYITKATKTLAGPRINTSSLDPISVKGISAPLPVFVLRGIISVEDVASMTTRTPFVGRRSELIQFRGMLELCLDEGHGQTVYVRGEPGIGKTRLVEQFESISMEAGGACHRGLVLPFGVGKGQDAIRSLVRSLLGITPGESKNNRILAAESALRDGRLDPEQAVFLNDLLDLPQSKDQKSLYDAMDNASRNEGKHAVVSALVAKTARNRPIVAIVEDVHWADALTLSHLSVMAKTVADCSALLVMTSRIEGDQLDHSWRSTTDGSPFVSIDLGPLREEDSRALIEGFIGPGDELTRHCLERAAGNPLFLEQLLRNAQEGISDALPDSIQSLVLARMDRLDANDKKALRAASVVGQRFDADVLRAILETNNYDCRELVRHNLVRPIAGGYLFTHALIQESVYGSLLKAQRRELHLKAARWFASSDKVLCAEHLAYADDPGAPNAFLEAAYQQAEQYRLEKALALARRGLELATDNKRFRLQCLKGELLRSLGSTAESIQVYREAKEDAASDIDRCRASVGVAEGLRIINAHEELLEEVQFAEAIAGEQGLALELARVHQLKGGVYFFLGETEACIEANQTALRYAEAADSPETKAPVLSGLGDAEYLRGRMLSAYRYFDQCIAISREEALGKVLAANLPMRGAGYRCQCAFAQAQRDFEEAISLAEETGQSRAEMIALSCGGWLFEWGQLDDGERWLERVCELARRLGSQLFMGEALSGLGRLAFLRGRWQEAERLCQAAVETLRDEGMRYMGGAALGTLALVTQNADVRRAALLEAEELLQGPSVSHNFFFFYPDAMETCLNTGQWDEVDRYAQALEDYTRAEPLPLTDFYIDRGRTLASFGRGDRDDATMVNIRRLHDEAERVGFKVVMPALERALAIR